MTQMKAVLVRQEGGPEGLELGTYPKPAPGPREVLVRVHATALNRADLLQREGKYPPPQGASPLLGLEMAGTVEALGEGVQGCRVGDRVCGLLSGGGYAEYVVLHEELALPIPSGLSFEEAAAIPEVFLTAYQALYWFGALQAGQYVLIHAGASGVGTAAIQLVRAAGAHALVTASAAKHDRCRALGAEAAIDYRSERFADRVREITGGAGAALILDFVGAPYFEANLDALALDGRLVLLATLGGTRLDRFDLTALFRKRAQVFATTLRARSLDYKIRLTRDFAAHALPLFGDGALRPVIDRVYPWTEVAEAHRRMAANENVGKLVLRVA